MLKSPCSYCFTDLSKFCVAIRRRCLAMLIMSFCVCQSLFCFASNRFNLSSLSFRLSTNNSLSSLVSSIRCFLCIPSKTSHFSPTPITQLGHSSRSEEHTSEHQSRGHLV